MIIPNFVTSANNDSNPHNLIYKVVVKLREIFNVKQKIDFLEDKIRINFLNWLDIISRKIKNVTYFDGDLIIIIEGASLMLEKDNMQENSMKFWIPKVLPDRVKLIISLDEESYNIEYFRSIGCEFLELDRSSMTINTTLDNYSRKSFIVEEEHANRLLSLIRNKISKSNNIDNLYVKVFTSCLIPHTQTGLFDQNLKMFNFIKKILSNDNNIKSIEKGVEAANDSEELITFILEFYKNKIIKEDHFFDLISLLMINYKGLYFDEIQKMVEITELKLSVICLLLKPFFIQHKNYWKITNPVFIKLFNKRYLKDKSKKKLLHLKISKVLDHKEDSIRKLEEQTNNLFHSEDYFSLKQKISSIDNFIILFNETTKIELFKFWKKLEKKGYDPVYEYNKALELFEMHYNPKDSELFILNIQISRFFKELSEFESSITPEFRHPYIQSKIVQDVETIEYKVDFKNDTDDKVSVEEEKVAPGDYFKTCENSESFGIGSNLTIYYKDYPKIFKNSEEEEYLLYDQNTTEHENEDKPINYLAEIGILKELELLKLYGINNKILKEHEALNIEIPLNRSKFVDYFEDKINEKEKFKLKNKKTTSDLYEFEIEDVNDEVIASNEMLILQDKQTEIDEYTKMIQNIDLTIEKSRPKMFYYYKRWIWMNFPLICLSKEKTSFSDLISYCYSENRVSLTFEQDRSIYFNCLLIINNLKESKKSVLKKKNNSQAQYSVTNKSVNKSIKKNDSIFNIKTKSKQHSIISKKSLNNSKSVYFSSDKKIVDRTMTGQRGTILPKSTFGKRRETQIKNALELSIQQKNNSTADLNKILKKSMQFEQSLMKSNFIDMKKQVFNQKNGKKNPSIYNNKINNLSQILEKWGSKELMLVTKKKDAILNNYNKIVYEKANLLEKIDKLENIKKQKQMESDGKKGPNNTVRNKDVFNVIYFQTKKKEMETSLQNVKNQKERYEAIIDICILNKIQNEDWIRNLTFYYNNLKSILAEKQNDLDQKNNQLIDIKFKSRQIYDKYQFNKEKKDIFIKNFVRYLNQKKDIDRAILHGKLKS